MRVASRWCPILVFGLVLLYVADHARAQTSNPLPYPKPSLEVTRRVGEINIDGDLSDSGWLHAAHTSTFTTAVPVVYSKPSVETEAWITYDDSYLYVAMRAYDPDPASIRASMIPRDRIFDEDFMGILLDTYGDASRCFELYTNPRGIQGDLFWSSTSEDESYDMIYDTQAKITSTGWQAEFRIPFRSLRYPNVTVQNFHLTFWRNYPRESVYKFSWAPINFYDPCLFCQFGSLTGIDHLPPSSKLELLPGVVATESGTATSASDNGSNFAQAPFRNDPIRVQPSLGVRYALGPATGLELALNPDFSQVEADASQVSANQTFALFYPERRPFFQDGSDLWNTYLSAVYTRSINDPIASAKVLHRDDVSSVAYLTGYDLHSPVIIPLEERSVILPNVGRSLSNIFRATRSFAGDTYLGVLATDRRYVASGSNSVAGLDTRIRLYENIEFLGQALYSYTRESNTPLVGMTNPGLLDGGGAQSDRFSGHTLEYDGESYGGNASYFALERFTSGLDMHVEYGQSSPTFRAGNGFIFSNAYHNVMGWAGYKYPLAVRPTLLKWLVEIDGTVSGSHTWNFDRATKLNAFKVGLDLSMVGQTDLHFFYRPYSEQFSGVKFQGLHQFDIRGETRFLQSLTFGGEATFGHIIDRDPASPMIGKETDLILYARLKPFDGLLLEPNYTYSRLDSIAGAPFYSGAIYRLKSTYQFTRELDLRLIVQYDEFARQFIADPLVSYKVNPFTNFFLGSSHGFESVESSGGLWAGGLRATDRQFFAKIQYLIQS